ncbi:MAG: carboxypeptidase-like regulatory domain-containing protein, partial [Candidatus Latescibacterota bacterium]
MRVVVAGVTAMVFISQSFAAVSGIVADSTGVPVAGALVTFIDEFHPDNRFSDTTDEQGRYEIELALVVEASAPFVFSLGQNYPNPFNPTTIIPFSLALPSRVTLSVYAVMGQHIATLTEGLMSAGHLAVSWNGRDERGWSVAAGIYFYQLRADE